MATIGIVGIYLGAEPGGRVGGLSVDARKLGPPGVPEALYL